MTTIPDAAGELATLFRDLADELATKVRPRRIHYGHGRLGHSLKRRSPAGFVLDPVHLQLLLPDGRLWSYSGGDPRSPSGRVFDFRTDYVKFECGHSYFGGSGFTFLGATVGKFIFGVCDGDGRDPDTARLCAVCAEGTSLRYVEVADAMADLAQTVLTREAKVA
ncbi:MAG: hypothetical protein ACR2JM_02470 [Mycobacterium sp.]